MSKRTSQIITTCTRDCPSTCGLIAEVDKDRVVALKGNPNHPITQGHTCEKRTKYLKRVYSPNRIVHPMRRDKHNHWEQITWDNALTEIALQLTNLIHTKGPESILYYQGFGIRTALQLLNNRFFSALGGVTTLQGTLCGGTGEASQNLDFGKRISHDPLDHLNSKTVILWGRNPVATQPPLMSILTQMRKKGGELVVVDPIRTESARLANRHIQPRPGHDLFLALAVASHIFESNCQDTSFITNHTINAETFTTLVNRWPKERLCQAAGVQIDDVEYLTKRLCQHRPAAILLGWGLHRWVKAHETIRAIDALGAISGNIGIPGGGISQGFDEYAPYDMTLQQTRHPNEQQESQKVGRKLLMPKIGEEILNAREPNIEMIFITAGNPLNMAPDSNRVKEAFNKTPFVVYCGQFMDDTAEASNLFLPVTTFLEENDIAAGYGHDFVGPVNPVIKPVGEARSHFQIFKNLAERLEIDDFSIDIDTWLSRLITPLSSQGITLTDVRTAPRRMSLPEVPYQDKQFPTPSGKFQLLTHIDTIPTKLNSPKQWPFILMSTSPKSFLCSERLPEDHPPLPTAIISANSSKQLSIQNGDSVCVKSQNGSLTAIIQIDPEQRDDVVIMHRGGWKKLGHGINCLTQSLVSDVGDGCSYFETRVRIERICSDG